MISSKTGFFRFKIAGIWITLDYLLPLSVLVIGWVLAARYFPAIVYLHNDSNYWILGILGSLSLLFSIIIHEIGHAFAANILRIPIERIHVYLFGGMAELRHRPLIPNQEFFVSMAGPVASGVLALVSFVLMSQFHPQSESIPYFLIHFIAYMNLMLAVFNLIPVYPLDGGRAVRALIWKSKKNYYNASRIMHRLSSVLIGFTFIISLVLFFFVDGYYAFWLGIFGLYVAYLLMKAKTELTSLPVFSELVFKIEDTFSPAQITQKILDINPDALKKSIVPVFLEQQFVGILTGEKIIQSFATTVELDHMIEEVSIGTYINLKEIETYHNDLQFKAEFLPVFDGDAFKGLCDAYEMRFWLLQTRKSSI
ncbi:hypothetical protein EP331_13805 [bacterium]|nr:MAG: hypothetical protein EP331_13805 [bacterium]